MEPAPRRRDDRAGHLAGEHDPPAGALRTGSGIGAADSSACVYGWRGAANRLARSATSTSWPRYITATRWARNSTAARSWVMNRQAKPSSDCSRPIRLSTAACTDTSSAEVGSSATSSDGRGRQRPGEADPLPLAAGELVRVAPADLGPQPDLVEQRVHPAGALGRRADPVQPQRLADDLGHGHPRVQRRRRVLEDDVEVAAAAAAAAAATSWEMSVPLIRTVPLGERLQPGHAAAERALAAAGLADQPEHLAGRDGEAHAVDRPDRAEVLDQVDDLQRGAVTGTPPRQRQRVEAAHRVPGRARAAAPAAATGTARRRTPHRSANVHASGEERSVGTRPGISR